MSDTPDSKSAQGGTSTSSAPLARSLTEMLIQQSRSPVRTLLRHTELNLMRGIERLNILPQARQQKLRRQIAKRAPERFLDAVGHVERRDRAAATAQEGPLFLPYDPTLEPPRTDVRAVAFYLPQFHPFPENDAWWGKGFTEWTNVGKARPLFDGHYQPHCPIHLGYYDLRLPEIMVEQARIARQYGIGGFAYHYYWFAGKTLMESPLRAMLANPAVDMPFFLSWANENWTRRWDGRDDDILIKQTHSAEDSRAMIRHIADYLRDPRYIRVNGRPVFSVYRPRSIPDLAATVAVWRAEARALGLGDLYLIGIQRDLHEDHRPDGFDANLEFVPHGLPQSDLSASYDLRGRSFHGKIYDYNHAARLALDQADDGLTRYRSVMLGWDNSARSPERGTIHVDFRIETYRDWLAQLCARARTDAWRGPDERMVFINAWNEWAEGTHLEPDQRHGFAYLDATRRALLGD